MLNQIAVVIFAVAILTSPLAAQTRAVTPRPAVGAVGHGGGVGLGHVHRGRSMGRGSILFPYPYDYYDYGYDNEQPPPPQVLVMPVASPAPAPPAAPLEPLLIEWQGDHFVRTTMSQKASENGQSGPDYSEKAKASSSPTPGSSSSRPSVPASPSSARKVAAQPSPELPPAVLVFRDGRTEELSSYTIMSGTIYSKTDYWNSGAWTKKIQIADLDVPATLKLNQEHGLNFVLPASPNEVVLRP